MEPNQDLYNDPALESLTEELVKIHKRAPSGTPQNNWPEGFALLEKKSTKLLLKFSARSTILKNDSLPEFTRMAESIIKVRDIKSRNTHSIIMLIATCTIACATLIQIALTIFK